MLKLKNFLSFSFVFVLIMLLSRNVLADGLFLNKVDYETGNDPRSVATGLFNDDAYLDLAVANYSSNTISILLGNGDGTFQAKVDYFIYRPTSIIVGLFNNDSYLDLVATDYISASISIFIGNGDGTFQNKVDYFSGLEPSFALSGLFNNDSYLDLAVANESDNTVSVLLGNGNGTFQARVYYWTGSNPKSITAGLFNDDAYLDLAVVNQGIDAVSVLLGNGNGTFQAKVDYGTGDYPRSVATGLFNDDAYLDLAVANATSNVSILLGNGNGTFQAKADFGDQDYSNSVTTGLFNDDAYLDLAVVNQGINAVSVLLGNGNGTFQAKVDYGTGSNPKSITTGLFNDDAYLDLVVVNSYSNTVSVLLHTTPDITPDQFIFTDQANIQRNSIIESNTITISGIDTGTAISISSCTGTACEYSINGGVYTSDAGTVVNGDTVKVHQTSSNSNNTQTDLTLDIGGITDTFSIITLPSYTLTYTAGEHGSISGTSPQTVDVNSDGSEVTAIPDSNYHFVDWSDTSTANPRIDTNVIENISITANFAFTFPGEFFFDDQANVNLSSIIESNTVTISGITDPTPISITTCETTCAYKINDGAYTTETGTVENGDEVTVQQTSASSFNTQTDLVLDIGGVVDIFSITTLLKEIEPEPKPITRHRSIGSGSSSAVIAQFQAEQLARALATGADTTPYLNGVSNTISPIPSSTLIFTRTLKFGMTGEDVRQLQIYLNTHGYSLAIVGDGSLGHETTYFGLKTKSAVIKFQIANGLVGDGVVGQLTRQKFK